MSLAEHFYSWTNILALDLSDNGVISVGHMFLISGGIYKLYYLQELNLSDSSINNAAATALAEQIQSCP